MNRHLVYSRLWLLTALFAFLAVGLSAQSHSARETALLFLQENPSKFELTKNDVSDVKVVREYSTKHNGVTHVWLQQQYHGIPVFNGLFGLHVKPNGEVMHLGHRFVNDLSPRINTDLPSLSAAKALEMAMANLGFTGFPLPALRSKANEQNFVFEGGAISKKQIPVSASYLLTNSGSVRLSWEMVIDQANTPDLWTITVDAQTGLISNKLNHTVYCQLGHAHRGGGADQCSETKVKSQQSPSYAKASAGKTVNSQQSKVNSQESAINELLLDEKYTVFALPIESPTYGNRTIETNPADPQASPFGWLDLDGAIGQENTFTHGNNVWAFDDSANDNTPDPNESVDGGATLDFDFPFNPVAEPVANKQAAITNLFYINNKMHDIFYRYGFDEEAGNFQNNNYGHGGNGNDEVFAQALDGLGTDNANFSTPADGGNGSMQMYVWNRKGIAVSVNGPGLVIGIYNGNSSDDSNPAWGGIITDVPVTGDVVVTSDGTGAPTLGCNPPINDVAGKIVMVDRSECEFGLKALNVQNAGGIACIICNFEDQDLNIGAGAVGGQVTIPTLIMHKVDCDLLRQYAGAGLNISINRPIPVPPAQRDGDFDNSIIMHEYHHGISTRLTGNGFDCLPNTTTHEQMGEGWSDWAALVNTVEPGDQGTDKRGIGNYALYKGNDGSGIRRYPYSTDMSIAPLTYGAVSSSVAPHGVGEVWANMVWDLYWAMVEKYGWDADINNTNSGNFRAIQLVVDGMKMQRCIPGFVDGRDAIMKADSMNYNAADACLISSVFARRGLGYLADQGDPANIGDGKENFDPIPTCVKELKINKITTTPTVNPGDNVSFEITVTNHKDAAATNVVVTDELPSGLTLVSASNGGVPSGGMVRWDLGTMPSGQVTKLTYIAKSAAGIGSNRYFHDLLEDELEWYANLVDLTTGEIFTLQSVVVHPGSGASAWAGKDVPIVSDYSLETTQHLTVTGSKPALRFWHQYETEAGVDAGFIEIQDKADPLMQWFRLPKGKALRGGYDGGVQYGTFAIPFLSGFSGNSNGWKQSYFDLSDYSGKDITFRFRFGSDANTAPATGAWYIDEVDVMDLFHYAGEACITADGGDLACSTAPEYGVIVEPVKVGTDETNKQSIQMLVQPNPADDMLHISLGQALEAQVIVSLIAADGRTVLNRTLQGLSLDQVLTLDVQNVPAGMYTVHLQSGAGNSVQKVVIR
ncbi:MAG: M36 family metallopeptidase [Phycisphaerae bacterium]|nr:M36 family metallopeptidase [Saprospiraceae bacterium]